MNTRHKIYLKKGKKKSLIVLAGNINHDTAESLSKGLKAFAKSEQPFTILSVPSDVKVQYFKL